MSVPQFGWLGDSGGPVTGLGVQVSLGAARGGEGWEMRGDTQPQEKQPIRQN